MTKSLNLLLVILLLNGCAEPEKEVVEKRKTLPHFNQVNTQFTSDHIQCLYTQFIPGHFKDTTYKDVGIVMSLIDDLEAYRSFFSCNPAITLPDIDFRHQSLLIGMNANRNVDTPINIKKIVQSLVRNDTVYSYNVIVTGSATEHKTGGEWFGFTALVPKIQGPVKLNISYVFN